MRRSSAPHGAVVAPTRASGRRKRDGLVESVDSTRIVVRPAKLSGATDPGVDIYNLVKYQRSNQNTCINQRPIVLAGPGQRLRRHRRRTVRRRWASSRSDATSWARSCRGVGKLEDSILISERVVREDQFTSVHIEEFECVARDTKLGREITRTSRTSARKREGLDESGIIRIGAE